MKEKEFKEKMDKIQEKIGQDASNLILDDIAILLNDNKQMNKEYNEQVEKNKVLEDKNEKLQLVNGNLLQQIPMEDDPKTKEKEEEEKKKPFDYRSVFDENRKF